jgi:hypothetical protein
VDTTHVSTQQNVFIATDIDYRYKYVLKRGRVGTGQYFEWIEDFTTWKNVLE